MHLPSLCLPVLLASPLAAQAGVWTRQYPVVPPALRGVVAGNALDAWCVGDDGTVVHTANGGATWSEHPFAQAGLRALRFVGVRGWAVGDGVWRTLDFGQTWEPTHGQGGLWDVDFVDPDHGWTVGAGGVVLRTQNGGSTWVAGSVGPSVELRAVEFLDASTGWAAGLGGSLFHTTDAGASWSPVASGTGALLSDLHFLDAQTGWIAAGDRVLHTTDGGATWTPQVLPAGALVESLDFANATRGWAVGATGDFLRTSNGGTTWNVKDSTGGVPLHGIEMADLDNGYAVGNGGAVYRTTDAGASWSLVAGGTVNPPPYVFSVDVLADGLHAWAGSYEGLVLRTVDGGDHWEPVTAGDATTTFYAVDFLDDLHGYAVGKRQGAYPTTAWTEDGGLHWNVTYHLGNYEMNDVEAIAPSKAVVCTSSYIWRTDDGGLSWTFVPTVPQSTYAGVDFVDALHGWVVGGDTFFQTSDGGASFQLATTANGDFTDVSFHDASHGWAVGADGAVLRTDDAGATWVDVAPAGAPYLHQVEAVGPASAWVTGEAGYVARTGDGGATWTVDAPDGGGGNSFYGAAFVDADHGFVVSAFPDVAVWSFSGEGCSVANYCQAKANSLGLEAALSGVGEPSASGPGFEVAVTGGVPKKLGLLLTSDAGEASIPFFGGTLCLAPPLTRLAVQKLDTQGSTSYAIPVTAGMVGTRRWFQFWYRDPQHPDGTGVALSDGLAVRFCL